jgi:hypothetical protein
MTKLYLLGARNGSAVDCIDSDRVGLVLTGEDDSLAAITDREHELRQAGQALQADWFNVQKLHGVDSPESLEAKWAYGVALRAWADFSGDQRARDHAYNLINGLA